LGGVDTGKTYEKDAANATQIIRARGLILMYGPYTDNYYATRSLTNILIQSQFGSLQSATKFISGGASKIFGGSDRIGWDGEEVAPSRCVVTGPEV